MVSLRCLTESDFFKMTSVYRFKLLFEESIEYNKLGLRDNVAQICVLEVCQSFCLENLCGLSVVIEVFLCWFLILLVYC